MREKLDRYLLRGLFADTEIEADPGSGGAKFLVDETGTPGTVVPYAKVAFGASGTQTPVSTSDPLPISDAGGAITVDGTVAVTNAGLTELAAAINASSQMDVNIAASAASVAVTNAGITTIAGAVSGTEMQVDVVAALPAGTNAIGKLAANSGVDIGDVDVTSISAGTNTIGGVTPRPETANGLSIARNIDLDNGTLDVVKGSAGQLYGWDITNRGTVTAYVKFYNATSGTLGTGTPVMTIGIPGNASDNTLSSKALAYGIAFDTGICVGAGTGVADNDNTDPGANIVVSNIYFK